jgi:hypothetical protein
MMRAPRKWAMCFTISATSNSFKHRQFEIFAAAFVAKTNRIAKVEILRFVVSHIRKGSNVEQEIIAIAKAMLMPKQRGLDCCCFYRMQ